MIKYICKRTKKKTVYLRVISSENFVRHNSVVESPIQGVDVRSGLPDDNRSIGMVSLLGQKPRIVDFDFGSRIFFFKVKQKSCHFGEDSGFVRWWCVRLDMGSKLDWIANVVFKGEARLGITLFDWPECVGGAQRKKINYYLFAPFLGLKYSVYFTIWHVFAIFSCFYVKKWK